MTRLISPKQMLATATKLAGVDAGPGRPARSDLRRATSTAYYALFHQISIHGAYATVLTADDDEVADVARWFTHKGIYEASMVVRDAADAAAGAKGAKAVAVELVRAGSDHEAVPGELTVLAASVIDLQKARHDADYSHHVDPRRADARAHVGAARKALDAARVMWDDWWPEQVIRPGLHDYYCRYLQLAALYSGGPRSRS